MPRQADLSTAPRFFDIAGITLAVSAGEPRDSERWTCLERCASSARRKSWAEHGMLDTPVEHACQAAHVLERRLGLLEDGKTAWKVKERQRRVAQFTEASP
jgi:hypothetical protein